MLTVEYQYVFDFGIPDSFIDNLLTIGNVLICVDYGLVDLRSLRLVPEE